MDARDLFAGMKEDVLVETLQAGLEVAKERGVEVPGAMGAVAVEGAANEAETDAEPTRIIEISELRELLTDQLAATYTGYQTTLEQINETRRKKDQVEVVDRETVEREFAEWLTDEKLAYPKAAMEADPDLMVTVVATPNVEADADELEKVAVAFADGGQPYSTYFNRSFISKYTAQELSGTDPGSGKAVRFSLVFSNVHPDLEGTCNQQLAKLAKLQETYPDLRVPSLLEDLTLWPTLRAQGNKLANGSDTFYETYHRHFDLEPRGGCVPDSYVGDAGGPGVHDSNAESVYDGAVAVG